LHETDGAPERVAILPTAAFAGLEDAARAYLARSGARPRRAAFAVAAPIAGDRVVLTNRDWSFSTEALRARLGLDELKVINDFEAIARALAHLPPAELRQVGGGAAEPGAPVAVLGPGTGLGVSAVVDGKPLATEGGHVTMPAADEREAEAIARIRARLGHVSAERVLSGPGLQNLYAALAGTDGAPDPDEITARALAKADAAAEETLDMFCAMLGTVAGNLALTYGARGGVYVAGGIVPKLGTVFDASRFRARFEDKGRFREWLAPIPVFVVTAEAPALTGLASMR
jgi:glucokinase